VQKGCRSQEKRLHTLEQDLPGPFYDAGDLVAPGQVTTGGPALLDVGDNHAGARFDCTRSRAVESYEDNRFLSTKSTKTANILFLFVFFVLFVDNFPAQNGRTG
jgi:hypothetical protein